MNLVSEWLPGLPPERLDIYKRTIPNHTKLSARPVDLFEREMPNIWHVSHGEGDDRVHLVGLFNWNFPERGRSSDSGAMEEPTTQEAQAAKRGEVGPVTVKLDPAQLGIPAGTELVGFDYWAKKFVPAFSGAQEFTLPPGSCKVFALRKKIDRPQLIGTSRHISQGLVDVIDVKWDEEKNVLSGRSRVVGDDPYELRIDTAGRKVEQVTTAGGGGRFETAAKAHGDDGGLRVTFTSPASGEVTWQVRFAK
jgi:hypothetical protein